MRDKKNACEPSVRETGVRICDRNNFADTRVSEELGAGGAPGAGAEIHLQPMEDPTLEQVDA